MVARMNISLPDELYEKAKKYSAKFNASGVCQQAIAFEIGKIEMAEQIKDKDAAEFRASRAEYQKEQHEHGQNFGAYYANFFKSYEFSVLISDEPASIDDLDEEWRDSLIELVETWGGKERDLHDERFWAGFLEGAREVFRELERRADALPPDQTPPKSDI